MTEKVRSPILLAILDIFDAEYCSYGRTFVRNNCSSITKRLKHAGKINALAAAFSFVRDCAA
jgi:hypothetical protein